MTTGKEMTNWADEAMFEATAMDVKNESGHAVPRVYLLWATPDPLGAVAAMYRMYEGKPTYDLDKLTNPEREYYWAEAKKSHLTAALEAVKFHFFVEGIDRAITHQMVRQRTAVFAQESLRFAVKNNLAEEVPLPPMMIKDSLDAGVWENAIKQIEEAYNFLIANGVPAEDARGLLPHAVPTRLNWVTDFANLIHHAGNRLCTQAQFAWRLVFGGLVQAIKQYRPDWPAPSRRAWQFQMIGGDDLFKPVCFRLGHCPWGEEMARPCTIRERVERKEFDQIETAEWLLDPNAARTVDSE